MVWKKNNGVGAVCSVLIHFLHPRKDAMTQYPNAKFIDCLNGLISQSRGIKTVNHKQQTVIVFRHNDFPNLMVYCNERYAKVLECGVDVDYFDGGAEEVGVENDDDELVEAINDTANDVLLSVPHLSVHNEIRDNIVRLITDGYQVDDDNEPAPENIPTATRSTSNNDDISWFPWGSRTVCQRRSQGHRFENPNLIDPPVTSRCIDYFLYSPPFIKDMVLVETNKHIIGREVT